jgi:NADPH:quinone reductase-like Zn-dependent oxidoreductase
VECIQLLIVIIEAKKADIQNQTTSIMAMHKAIATLEIRAKLGLIDVPTIKPTGREVLVRVEWTASTPLDLHQNDGGLLVKHPQILGDSLAGTVVEVGAEVKTLTVGDKVFGFSFEDQKKKAHQEFATVTETSLSKVHSFYTSPRNITANLNQLPQSFTLQETVTLPNNVVTVFHTVTVDLGLPLPYPLTQTPPPHSSTPILIWGGSSSVGQYALQVLTYWGYKNLITTASSAHHSYLKTLGASHVFNYRDNDVSEQINRAFPDGIPFVFDCIGSKTGSLAHLAKVARKGARVAVLMPVIVVDAGEDVVPEYSMAAEEHAEWVEGVEVRNVRTHLYAEVSLQA